MDGGGAYLCYHLAHFTEVCTPPDGALCEEIFNETCPYVVTHLLQLFIDFIVILVVLDELDYEGAIREGEELCIL